MKHKNAIDGMKEIKDSELKKVSKPLLDKMLADHKQIDPTKTIIYELICDAIRKSEQKVDTEAIKKSMLDFEILERSVNSNLDFAKPYLESINWGWIA